MSVLGEMNNEALLICLVVVDGGGGGHDEKARGPNERPRGYHFYAPSGLRHTSTSTIIIVVVVVRLTTIKREIERKKLESPSKQTSQGTNIIFT